VCHYERNIKPEKPRRPSEFNETQRGAARTERMRQSSAQQRGTADGHRFHSEPGLIERARPGRPALRKIVAAREDVQGSKKEKRWADPEGRSGGQFLPVGKNSALLSLHSVRSFAAIRFKSRATLFAAACSWPARQAPLAAVRYVDVNTQSDAALTPTGPRPPAIIQDASMPRGGRRDVVTNGIYATRGGCGGTMTNRVAVENG